VEASTSSNTQGLYMDYFRRPGHNRGWSARKKQSSLTSFPEIIFITKTVNYFSQTAPKHVSICSFLTPNWFTYFWTLTLHNTRNRLAKHNVYWHTLISNVHIKNKITIKSVEKCSFCETIETITLTIVNEVCVRTPK
jgi:CRISPR-associated protein Cas8b1/Cst1 subtype I-B